MKNIGLHFHGPLTWIHAEDAEFIMDSDVAEKHGVYMWTVDTPDGFRVWYVGQTRSSFKKRMREHFKEQMCGCYEAYDPDLLAQGELKQIWPGYYVKSLANQFAEFPDALPALWSALTRTAKMTRFLLPRLRVTKGCTAGLKEESGDTFVGNP